MPMIVLDNTCGGEWVKEDHPVASCSYELLLGAMTSNQICKNCKHMFPFWSRILASVSA